MPPKVEERTPLSVSEALRVRRGEDFRRNQNLLRSRAHLHNTSYTSSPSLPPGLNGVTGENINGVNALTPNSRHSRFTKGVAGPSPPPSWLQSREQFASGSSSSRFESVDWRQDALSFFFSHAPPYTSSSPPRIPTLHDMCIRVIVEDGDLEEVVPYLYSSLRRDICRYAAVYDPLSTSDILLLASYQDGGTDGELILSGPGAKLSTILPRINPQSIPDRSDAEWDEDLPNLSAINLEEPSWAQSLAAAEVQPLQHLVLISTTCPPPMLSHLPPTITHLVLIDLPTLPLVPLWRLPGLLPLASFVDLSYNPWIRTTKSFDKISWHGWRRLRTVRLKSCGYDYEPGREAASKRINANSRQRQHIVDVYF
ncbi:hypothetical protein SISNIDRAFT_490753 [Sistotremastrum niveocremeum HHB9708]|uniref:Uncharacterized protein n=1 Tax=Sistotremastrum niveocremeum HHB9708 TaxID=1314777 RepID=A0A164NK60_9AGAM|nr:hypothetical protein SISNIDRAFT_490753 [Sistotremastrum niveocremeum HHB9708]